MVLESGDSLHIIFYYILCFVFTSFKFLKDITISTSRIIQIHIFLIWVCRRNAITFHVRYFNLSAQVYLLVLYRNSLYNLYCFLIRIIVRTFLEHKNDYHTTASFITLIVLPTPWVLLDVDMLSDVLEHRSGLQQFHFIVILVLAIKPAIVGFTISSTLGINRSSFLGIALDVILVITL